MVNKKESLEVQDYEAWKEAQIDRLVADIDGLCNARLKQINENLCTERPPYYPPAHLVTLARAVHVMAMRTIDSTTHPAAGVQQGGHVEKGRYPGREVQA